ncbi:MAG TPA: hypothetical protein VIB39_17700, partial [Candidatus Angelobacter sp.]
LKAGSFLPWLADMRATWKELFMPFVAGFVQGLRAATATKRPELYPNLISALGGRPTADPPWPVTASLAEVLATLTVVPEHHAISLDAKRLEQISKDEQATFERLSTLIGKNARDIGKHPIPIEIDYSRMGEVFRTINNPQGLWLLIFTLIEFGRGLCQHEGSFGEGVSVLQSAQLFLQKGIADPRYFESLLLFTIHGEPGEIWKSKLRRSKSSVFQLLGYSHSRAITCGQTFQASMKVVHSGAAKSGLWSVVWSGMNRIRACEGAFLSWAQHDQDLYAEAAPALLALARTQATMIAVMSKFLVELGEKSILLPWHMILTKKVPNVESEFEWCKALLDIMPNAKDFPEKLCQHFDRLRKAVDVEHLGNDDIAFNAS